MIYIMAKLIQFPDSSLRRNSKLEATRELEVWRKENQFSHIPVVAQAWFFLEQAATKNGIKLLTGAIHSTCFS
jgi:hypothetical protein